MIECLHRFGQDQKSNWEYWASTHEFMNECVREISGYLLLSAGPTVCVFVVSNLLFFPLRWSIITHCFEDVITITDVISIFFDRSLPAWSPAVSSFRWEFPRFSQIFTSFRKSILKFATLDPNAKEIEDECVEQTGATLCEPSPNTFSLRLNMSLSSYMQLDPSSSLRLSHLCWTWCTTLVALVWGLAAVQVVRWNFSTNRYHFK